MVKQEIYPELDLIVHRVVGRLEDNEFLEAATALYDRDPPILLSLWDLSRASVSQYSLERVRALQSRALPLVRGRDGGRTAVVAPADLAFGISRQYTALSDSAQLPFEHHVFRTTEEALAWLGLEADCLDASAPEELT